MNQQQTTHRLLIAIDKKIDLNTDQAEVIRKHLEYAYAVGYESFRYEITGGLADGYNKPVRKYINDKHINTYFSINQAAASIAADPQNVITAIQRGTKIRNFWFEYA
jgi:predicted metal-dependent HD superfamily phosphohydrolase